MNSEKLADLEPMLLKKYFVQARKELKMMSKRELERKMIQLLLSNRILQEELNELKTKQEGK